MGKNVEVSVIVVCFNEEKNIGACIESILKQDFPGFEIIVVDGNSTDRTVEIVRGYEKSDNNIRVVVNEKRTIASNRNVGVRHAKGKFIAFTDADCIVPVNWLSVLVSGFMENRARYPDMAAVGGGNVPPENASGFLAALGIVQNTFLGSLGSVQGKRYEKPHFVPSLATLNVLYEKDKLEKAGLFDEAMGNICEDADMNYRLRKNNYQLLYLPDAYVVHGLRPTFIKWAENMFAYGKGRAGLIIKHGTIMSFVYLLPLMFLLIMMSTAFCVFNRLFLIPLLYFPAISIMGAWVSLINRKPLLAPYVIFIYMLQHFAYAAGEAYGMIVSRKD